MYVGLGAILACAFAFSQSGGSQGTGGTGSDKLDGIVLPKNGLKKDIIGGGRQVEFSYRWVDTGRTNFRNSRCLTCGQICRGEVHNGHAECDLSCDNKCPIQHHLKMSGDFDYNPDVHRDLIKASNGYTFGEFDVGLIIGHLAKDLAKDLIDKSNIDKDIPHWEMAPCTTSTRTYGYRVVELQATWAISSHDWVADENGHYVFFDKIIATGKCIMGSAYLPSEKVMFQGSPMVRCACHQTFTGVNFIKIPEFTTTVSLPNTKPVWIPTDADHVKQYQPPFVPPTVQWYPGGVYRANDGLLLNSADLNSIQLKVNCLNMNEVEITGTNMTMMPMTIFIAPGTIFKPANMTYQSMVSQTAMVLPLPGYIPAFAGCGSIDIRRAESVTTTGRIGCTEMGKHAPDSNVSYNIGPLADQRLAALAWETARTPFHGPWDQVRIWIISDHAQMDQIRKRMIPGPSPAMYLRSAHIVSTVSGVDFGDSEFKACLEPRFCMAIGSDREDVQWLVDQLDRTQPGAIEKWIAAHANDIKSLVDGANSKDAIASIGIVSDVLISSNSSKLQMAGFDILKDIPNSDRSGVLAADGLKSLISCLMSDDETIVIRALDTAVEYSDSNALDAAKMLVNDGKTKRVKDRAVMAVKQLAAN